jgi:hypothetical protein
MSAQGVGKWVAQRQRVIEETQEQLRRANRLLAVLGEPFSATLLDAVERLVKVDADRLEEIMGMNGANPMRLTFFDATANDFIEQKGVGDRTTGPDLLAEHMRNAWRTRPE